MSLEGRTIAIVEDDPIMGESLMDRLALEGAKVHWWQTRGAAVTGLETLLPDLVVCDIRLPDGNGEDVFRTASEIPDAPPFLFLTGFGDIDQAVRLMRCGAGDYLTKPFDPATFLTRLTQLIRSRPLPGKTELGVSPEMKAVERMLRRVARLTIPVLITGETGSGKEVCTRFLHLISAGAAGPFMAVNCAAIPKDLMESELFGHERGAFTGATSRHRGYAERSGTGTLFLDEIGELDLNLQAKLLRLIEDRTFHRVGGEEAVRFKARLVCATNADLDARTKAGLFREDLLYRINVLSIAIPPLRNRADDIEWLANRFFDEFAGLQDTEMRGLSALAAEALHDHGWPGNVRELRNRVERAVALALGEWIMPADLFPEFRDKNAGGVAGLLPLAAVRDAAERRQIERALRSSGGQIAEAAALLGISRTTMWEKMRRLGIDAGGISER
jgi:DNA-binding NtrC family response regulator